MFQLTEPGEYFLDTGFYFENPASRPRPGGTPLRMRQRSDSADRQGYPASFTHTLNLFLTRQFGPDQTSHGLEITYAWQSRWNIWAPLSPAIEFYGDAGELGNSPSFSRQQLIVGPVGVGSLRLDQLRLGHGGNLKYELGWLFGATDASARGTLRWRLEVEIPF